MRMCLDGKTPQPAKERIAKDMMTPTAKAFRGKYSAYLLEAIDAATQLNPSDRPQSAQEMLRLLKVG